MRKISATTPCILGEKELRDLGKFQGPQDIFTIVL